MAKWSALIVCLAAAIVAVNELQPFQAVSCSSSEDYLAASGQQVAATAGADDDTGPISAAQADRIKSILRRYLQLQEMAPNYARIQTRSNQVGDQKDTYESRKQSAQAIIDKWLESTIFELAKKSTTNADNNNKDTLDGAASSSSSSLLSSGYKIARNYQPVMMRLPPRFGKRSIGFQ